MQHPKIKSFKKMKKIELLEAFGILLLIQFFSIPFHAQTIILPNDPTVTIIKDVDYIIDSLMEFKEEDLFSEKMQSAFNPTSLENNGFQALVSTYWIRFELKNNAALDNEWLLDFENWSFVDFYIVSDRQIQEKWKTGHLLPYNQRQYPEGNKNHILLSIKSGETIYCYARLEFESDNFIKPANLEFHAGLRSSVDQQNYRQKQIISVFLGILFVMFFYHLFIYFSTRSTSYIYYLAIVALIIYMTLNNSGYIVEVFKNIESFPMWRGLFESIGSALTPVLMMFFTMEILKTKKNLPFWHKVMTVFIGIILFLTVLVNINFQIFSPYIFLSSFLVVIVFITIGIFAVIRKLPSAVFYLVAYSFSLAGVAIMFMSLGGAIPKSNFATHYSMPLGYTLEIIFYSLALANIINLLKKENIQKQEEIIDQLKENQLLQTKVNRELETKVVERTMEIREQNKIIEIEKVKSDELLLNILPSATAEELKTYGKATAKSFINASVLFTDFENFTQLCENMTPDMIVENLDTCFHAFDDIVMELNLEKIKTIGDSYMCAEGIPEHNKSNPSNIVEAGLRMQEFIANWNDEKKKKGEKSWPMRVGINSGPLIAGVVGKKKFAYDIWGHTVNLAARMESASEIGKVNVSEFTMNLVKDKFKFISRGKLPAKNYGFVEMYFVERKKPS